VHGSRLSNKTQASTLGPFCVLKAYDLSSLFYFGKKIKGDNASSVSAQNLATTMVIEKLKL